MSAPMTARRGYRFTRANSGSPAAFVELAAVELTAEVKSMDGDLVPAGTVGTVVGIWGEGSAYEVEFSAPDTVATVDADKLRAVHGGA